MIQMDRNHQENPEDKRKRRQGAWMKGVRAACLLAVLCSFLACIHVSAQDVPKAVDEAKAGVVHIRSGCVTNSKTLETREQTGFLVGEKGGEPCVVTTSKNLEYSDADIKRLSKQYQLGENEQISTRIYMILQGDVKYELGVVGTSDMLNLALLRPQQSLTDKYILEFAGNPAEKGQEVYFLCFPPGKGQAASYSKNTVQANRTKVTNLATRMEGTQDSGSAGRSGKEDRPQFFYHGVQGGESILGGPFVDEKGRVVGMITGAEVSEAADGGAGKDNRIALSAREIMKFLDLHNVKYTEEKKAAIEAKKKNIFPIILGILTALAAVLTIVRMVRMNGAPALPGAGGSQGQAEPDPDSTLPKTGPKIRAKNQPEAYLLRLSTHERIPICYATFGIGSAPSGNDYVVDGNRKVSRKHIMISFEKGKYYIEDLGSTNGTFIDGALLEPGRKQRLENGSEIRLADEEFVFQGK